MYPLLAEPSHAQETLLAKGPPSVASETSLIALAGHAVLLQQARELTAAYPALTTPQVFSPKALRLCRKSSRQQQKQQRTTTSDQPRRREVRFVSPHSDEPPSDGRACPAPPTAFGNVITHESPSNLLRRAPHTLNVPTTTGHTSSSPSVSATTSSTMNKRSASIAIQRQPLPEGWSDDDDYEPDSHQHYDQLTWRMYHRIMDHRIKHPAYQQHIDPVLEPPERPGAPPPPLIEEDFNSIFAMEL